MSKEAKTNNNKIHPHLSERWSPRAFEDKAIEEEKLRNILEAARWSPSASNIQPWIFFVGSKGDDTYNKIFDCLVEFNQMWNATTPVLILNCGKMTNDDGNANVTWKYDTGQAVAHLSFQAMEEDLFVHQMSGFDIDKAAKLFNLPDNVRAISISAIGYLGDPSLLHPRMQKSELAERERNEMNTFVFENEFGNPSKIV